ncbi:MAPEG family protein [Phenylobacterium sp.]|uniref:MAPEG family protein n=1 Tax=Phenylobacterium sp. TaxID=1871053 RepID=UPI0025DB46B4|nr:MAPEG family protein [Phenylobacterium sp.]
MVAVELKLLMAAVVIGFAQLMWAAAAARRQQDLKWAAGSRDTPKPVTGVAARLQRAFWNFVETFPLFAAAILTDAVAGKLGGSLTLWGAALYVGGRAAYVPLYATGVPIVRSVVWGVSIVGLGMTVVALFR